MTSKAVLLAGLITVSAIPCPFVLSLSKHERGYSPFDKLRANGDWDTDGRNNDHRPFGGMG